MGNKLKYNPISGIFDFVGGGGRPYPPLPVGSYYTPAENYVTPGNTSFALNIFFSQIFWNEDDYEMSEARVRPTSSVVGEGIVGVYRFDITNNRWLLEDITVSFDTSIISDQILGFVSGVSLKANNYYAIGMIKNVTSNMASVGMTSQRTFFGYGGNYISSHNSCLQFTHTYDGTLPAIIDPPTYGSGSGAILPMIYFK